MLSPLFYEEFFFKLVNFSSCEYIIGGDYNLVLDNHLDKHVGLPHSNQNAQK